MTLQSNNPDMLASADALLASIAQGEARGDANIGFYAVALADQIANGVREFPEVMGCYDQRFVYINAEKRAMGRPEVETPQGTSRNTQVTKMRTVAYLGVIERTRAGTIEVLRTVATVPGCQWRYKALVVASAAIAAAYKADNDATDGDLLDAAQTAIDNLQDDKAKTVGTELAKIIKAWDKLNAGDFGADLRKASEHGGRDAAGQTHAALTLMVASVNSYLADITLGK